MSRGGRGRSRDRGQGCWVRQSEGLWWWGSGGCQIGHGSKTGRVLCCLPSRIGDFLLEIRSQYYLECYIGMFDLSIDQYCILLSLFTSAVLFIVLADIAFSTFKHFNILLYLHACLFVPNIQVFDFTLFAVIVT